MNRTTPREPPPADSQEPSEQWLTVYQVAGQLLARPDTVKAWVREGLLRGEDRGRLGVRIPKHAVEAFMAERFQSEGFRSADHSLSSGMTEAVLAATELSEQSVARQAAGWPFRKDAEVMPRATDR